MNTFMGMRIVTNNVLTVPAEDWSKVRSPSRARRRLKKGHRQNIRYYDAPLPRAMIVGDVMYCHPDMLMELRRAAAASGVGL